MVVGDMVAGRGDKEKPTEPWETVVRDVVLGREDKEKSTLPLEAVVRDVVSGQEDKDIPASTHRSMDVRVLCSLDVLIYFLMSSFFYVCP